jgi:hypothetical protein
MTTTKPQPSTPGASEPQPPADRNQAFLTGLKWGFFGYFGVYIFAFLVGLLCAGAMLLVGFILAALR